MIGLQISFIISINISKFLNIYYTKIFLLIEKIIKFNINIF